MTRAWRPRCEGCGRFVAIADHHFSDYRWCDRCADGLSLNDYANQAFVSGFKARLHGWPMWPLSDIGRAA